MKKDGATNSRKPAHKRRRLACLTALLVPFFVLAQHPQAFGQPNRDLEMTVRVEGSPESPSKLPRFRVELRNVADHDLILNLGIMLANGRSQYADAIVLTILDANGKTRRFSLKGPMFVAGRVDPLIVPLPVASTLSIPVDLDKYWSTSPQEFDYKFERGAYSLQAQFTGKSVAQAEANLDVKGIALMSYWTGSVASNQLQFKVQK